MKTAQIIILLFFIVSCGEKNHSSKSIKESEPHPTPVKESFSFEAHQKKLTSKGIHFARLSQLQNVNKPLTIYCSNTTLLNHEKIEELLKLSNNLQQSTITEISIEKKIIDKQFLLILIQEAINSLEVEPYSSTCPKIYLTIQDN